jgi:hypothetical protein
MISRKYSAVNRLAELLAELSDIGSLVLCCQPKHIVSDLPVSLLSSCRVPIYYL